MQESMHGQTNENDKGYVSISYNEYVTKDWAHWIISFIWSLLSTFILLTPVALAKSVSLYYPKFIAKSSTGDFMGCLYWTTATMAFSAIFCTFLSIWHQFKEDHPTITSGFLHNMSHNCSIHLMQIFLTVRSSSPCGKSHNHSKCSVDRSAHFHL